MSDDIEDEMETEVGQLDTDIDVFRIEISPHDLVDNDWNPNVMEDEDYELLKEQISEIGFIDPPTVVEVEDDRGNVFYRLIGGHNRAAIARDLGLSKIPVDVLIGERWKDEDLQKLQTVRLNVLHGKIDPEKMVAIYNEMATKYGDQATSMLGFSNDYGIQKMIKQVSQSLKGAVPPEMAEQFQEQAKEARTISDIERIIQQLFQEHGDTMNYNFMVFAWGGKEHIYIAMTKKTREALKKIMKVARNDEVDINELIGDAIQDVAKSLTGSRRGRAASA